jgi:hypothetical protein
MKSVLRHTSRLLVVSGVLQTIAAHPLSSSENRVSRNHQGYKPLTFTENGTFQISVFEDLHFGESGLYACPYL